MLNKALTFISKMVIFGLLLPMVNPLFAGSLDVSSYPPFIQMDYDPVAQVIKEEKAAEEQRAAPQELPQITTKLLGAVVLGNPILPFKRIVTNNELQELQLNYIIDQIDNTTTGFGYWALKNMTVPIQDVQEILRRQRMIRYFVTNEKESKQIKSLLNRIKKAEKAILNYWNLSEHRRVGSVFNRAESLFFYSFRPRSINDALNNNALTLEAGHLLDGFLAFKALAFFWGAQTFIKDWSDYSSGQKQDFNVAATAWKALWSPLRDLNIFSSTYDSSTQFSARTWWDAMFGTESTAKDKFHAMANWGDDGVQGISVPGVVSNWKPNTAYADLVRNNRFVRWMSNFNALSGIVMYLGLKASGLWITGRGTWNSLKNLYTTANDLQDHLVTVRHGLLAMRELDRMVRSVNAKLDNELLLFDARPAYSSNIKRLFTLLEKDTFKESGLRIYSRGNVLLAHRLMSEYSHELIPLFRSIGEIDAYVSMADLYAQSKKSDACYSFVEFVDTQEPYLSITNGWVPLINKKNIVCNSLTLGGNKPRAAIITGPNGGGKSANLKMVGIVTAFGLSWGIAPAEQVYMTPLDMLRTSFNPGEQMTEAMSRFMAQKESIDRIKQTVLRTSPDQRIMILADEAFTGTVEDVSAHLTYEFAKAMIHQHNALSILATHVKKPIHLADEFPDLCTNYQVEIMSKPNGEFERTYMLKPGPAMWWFDDENLRNKYVPWLGKEIRKVRAKRS